MSEYSSNCYWFVYAWLKDSDDEFYLARDEALREVKYSHTWLEKISDDLYEILDNVVYNPYLEWDWYKIIEIFDSNKKSQHVAFLDWNWKFYDQDGPDWPIRITKSLDDLLYEYKSLFGTAYYQVHALSQKQSSNVENFISRL